MTAVERLIKKISPATQIIRLLGGGFLYSFATLSYFKFLVFTSTHFLSV